MSAKELREAAISVRNGAAHIRAEKCSESVEPLRELLAQHNELAADACTTLAAQMESAGQGFEEWAPSHGLSLTQREYGLNYTNYKSADTLWAATAWHAARASLQAQLDAAEAENIRLREAMNKYSEDETLHTIQSLKAELEVAKHTEALDMQMHVDRAAALDAANERVKELEAKQSEYLDEVLKRTRFMEMEGYRRCDIPACNCDSWHGGNAYRRLVEIRDTLEEAGYSTNGTTILGALKAALATAERERELLRKEVRRCWELADKELGPPSDFCVYCDAQREDRPAEVRALVGTTADIKDT